MRTPTRRQPDGGDKVSVGPECLRISDGNVCWPDALYWSDWYLCPWISLSWFSLARKVDRQKWESQSTARALRRPAAETWLSLLRQAGIDMTIVVKREIVRQAARIAAAEASPGT
jgi:hypothetical protein